MRSASGSVSGPFKVVVPHVDIDAVLGLCLRAPQFARLEAHGIEVLRFLALPIGAGVRKHVDAMVPRYDTDPAARVTREPRVRRRIDVARPDALADAEIRDRGHIAFLRRAIG